MATSAIPPTAHAMAITGEKDWLVVLEVGGRSGEDVGGTNNIVLLTTMVDDML